MLSLSVGHQQRAWSWTAYEQANGFHTTIKFMDEISHEESIFLGMIVYMLCVSV